MEKKNILTGDRPTGKLHLGHYFGSLKNRVELQDKYNTYIIIADVQALTDNFYTPEKVRDNIREVAIDNLSVGIDPEKSVIFIQSMIPEIAELTVFYSNLVTISRLYRNPTVKSEINQKKGLFGEKGEGVTYGFLGYPVSQAADITAFEGAIVPVGEDQLPVLEQTREIVRKFNSTYGDTLVEPNYFASSSPRIKGLDGNEKMGKSLGNAIYLADSPEEVGSKIMSAITDPNKIKKDDPANPDVCMVYYYHNLICKDNLKTIRRECQNGSRGCVNCKKELIANMLQFLKPIQEKRKYYEEHPEVVDKILIEGTKKARTKASQVMNKVRKSMKIDYFE
jgi:tryptophanyl-tRNA synthetase